MNKFEKLIEYIINDEDQKARELFHTIVVEKSRDIYESIMDEEQMEEKVHGDEVGDVLDEIDMEENMQEADDEFSLDDETEDGEASGDFPADSEHEEHEEHEEIEDTVLNIDSKLDELLAKFDEIMGDKEHDDMEEPEDDIEETMFEDAEEDEKMKKAEEPEDGKANMKNKSNAKDPKAKDGKPFESRKSTSDLMREYVEKIEDINLTPASYKEGDAVGAAGKRVAVNTKPGSVGPGANFGGESVDFAGEEQNPDNKAIPNPSNEYNKGQGEIKSGNVNVPGGKAGKTAFKHKEGSYETAGDGQGSESGSKVGAAKDGKVSINKKSELGQAGQPTGKKQ